LSTTGLYVDEDGEWNVGQLNPNQVEILEITVEVLGFGDYLNVAYVENADGGDDIIQIMTRMKLLLSQYA
jgi:hypothetical protein